MSHRLDRDPQNEVQRGPKSPRNNNLSNVRAASPHQPEAPARENAGPRWRFGLVSPSKVDQVIIARTLTPEVQVMSTSWHLVNITTIILLAVLVQAIFPTSSEPSTTNSRDRVGFVTLRHTVAHD